MNDNLNNKVVILPPFKRFCMTIGELPTSYIISMTYEEQLIWFCNYLEKTVIPAINENGAAVTELQEKYVELKGYVDNYFENLDVQTEINNKLDQMAESGELEEIITQYLEINGVLAFDTISDLESADNIIDGSTCYVLGKDTYNDGFGGFYKIRTTVAGDVVDGYNIVSLDISETLIAERIKKVKESFDLNYYLGAFHKKYSEQDKRTYLFLSNDAVNFTKIPNIEIHGDSSSGGGDPSIMYDPETKYFLVAYSNQDVVGSTHYCFTVMRSKNLTTWEEFPITLNLPNNIQGYNKWAPDFFRDEDGDLYVIFSADKTQNGYDFVNFITKCTSVENMTFDTPFSISVSDNCNLYDNSIVYFNNRYYMVGVNFDEGGLGLKMYQSDDMVNYTLVNENVTKEYYKGANAQHAIEGCNLAIINDKLFVYAEMPNASRYLVAEYNTTTNAIEFVNLIPSLQGYKHGSVMSIDDSVARDTVNTVAKNIVGYNDVIKTNVIRMYITINEDTTIDKYTIQPNEIMVINGNGHTLTINKIIDPYKINELKYTIYDANGTLSIGGYEDDQYSSYTYTAIAGTGKKEKTIDFRFNAMDNSYDFLVSDTGIQDVTLSTGIDGHIYYERIGKIVNILFNVTGTYSYGLLLGTLPSGFRPKANTIVSVCNRSHESDNEYIGVNNNGNVTYIGNNTSGNLVGCITYLV